MLVCYIGSGGGAFAAEGRLALLRTYGAREESCNNRGVACC